MNNITIQKTLRIALIAIVLISYYAFSLLDGLFATIFSPGVVTGLNAIAWITLIFAPIFITAYIMVFVLLVEYLVTKDVDWFLHKYKVLANIMLLFAAILSVATLMQLKGTGLAFLAPQTLAMAIAIRANAAKGSRSLHSVMFYVAVFLILATFLSFGQIFHYRNIMLYGTLLGSWLAYGYCASYISTHLREVVA